MAIFYDYIKGTKGDGSVITYIKFTNSHPEIEKGGTSLGYILTTGGAEQTIEKNITLKEGEKFNFRKNSGLYGCWLTYDSENDRLVFDFGEKQPLKVLENEIHFWGKKLSLSKGALQFDYSLKTISSFSATGAISSNVSVTAPYFNATSDIEAKTNLTPLSTALPLILHTNIYSFNYKTNLDKRTIGVLAQELEKLDFEGISLVEPANSSSGYKAVNESKLVYVLWRGIQEQQEQIAELQRQVAELSRKDKDEFLIS